jgi:hypothetical protein
MREPNERLNNEYIVRHHSLCDTSHFGKFRELASECDVIAESGIHIGNSTIAFMMGLPKKMIGVDPYEVGGITEQLTSLAFENGIDYEFIHSSIFDVDLPEVDLFFIDSVHLYPFCKDELERNHSKVRRYIGFHDTNDLHSRNYREDSLFLESIKRYDDLQLNKSVIHAVREFLEERPEWKICYESKESCGCIFIKRTI